MYIYVDGFYDCFNKSYFVYVYDLRFFLNLEKKIIVKFSKKEKVLVRILLGFWLLKILYNVMFYLC